MEKQSNIPTLRFPGFIDQWEQKRLKSVAQIFDGTHQTPDYVKDGVPFFSVEQVTANDFANTKFITQEVFDRENKRIKIEKGDILMTRIGDIGTSKLLDWEVRASFYVSLALIKQSSKYNSSFLNQYISTAIFQKELWSKTIHVAFPKKINLGEIGYCEICLPSLPEQQKIASFLTAIDNRLQLIKKKKTLLEQYKKGVMQKLFSQELRFKDDGSGEFPEWEKKKLGDVSEIIMGQSPDSISYNTDNIGMPLIQGNADIQSRISSPRNWTSKVTKECQIGDLLLTVRAPVGAVAKSLHHACIGRGVCAIRNNPQSNIEFLFQFLLYYESKWSNIEQGSTFTAVSGTEIKKLQIILPCIEEQNKIAVFLSAIDLKIDNCNVPIEQTTLYKKGLLQKMFC